MVLAALALNGAGAGAAQQCDTSVHPLSSPSGRFVDHGDGTVTDQESQLMWMRCSGGQQWASGRCVGSPTPSGWSAAQAAAGQVNRQGDFFFNDWRLPSVRELATIAERQCRDPRINLAIFPGTPSAAYWTTTPRPGRAEQDAALVLDFGAGGVRPLAKGDPAHLRLVRSAP